MNGVGVAMTEIEKYQYESDGNLVDWLQKTSKTRLEEHVWRWLNATKESLMMISP